MLAIPRWTRLGQLTLIGVCLSPAIAVATTYDVDPSNYRSFLAGLQPGDTLRLAPGRYVRLTLSGIAGTPAAWITITGPESGAEAVIEGESCCNTVQLYGSSYVTVRNLTVDGKGLNVDGINAKDQISHHILIENCKLINLGFDQQTVGISTKSTAWGWTIRNNQILEAGTGIYLGNSDGSAPFIGGIIEGNLIRYPIGYCMQIKHQNPYTLLSGMPAGPNRTIIRDNVFVKDDRPSPDGDRPNLLVGTFPDTGPGSGDLYEIYGNFLYHNPRESLLQATGRSSIHDNIFVDAGVGESAILLTDHYGPLKLVHIYNNTIYGGARGIYFVNSPRVIASVVGNLVFAGAPIGWCGSCSITDVRGNLTDAVGNAGQYVTNPSTTLGVMDFYPRSDCPGCSSSALDLSLFATNTDFDRDFNRSPKFFTFRGAYAGAGTNPGWRLTDSRKGAGSPPGPGGDSIAPQATTDLRAQ